jgi:alpha-methylacyl-CoA racemase
LYGVGMTGIPIVNVNNNCSTGPTALFLARQAVQGGAADVDRDLWRKAGELGMLLALAGVSDPAFAAQWDSDDWPALKEKFAALFATRTRDAWCVLLEGTDACFAPVLDLDEAPRHPHNAARQTFVDVDGVTQPAPAPRFSRTPGHAAQVAALGQDGAVILADWGWDEAVIAALRRDNIV